MTISNVIYENGTLTALLFDGGDVSLDFIRPFLAMPKLKPASLWSFGLTKTFTKSGSGTNATYTPTYHFYMKDHLGSNRVVASTTGEAEQVNHYYPYGSTFYGESSTDHRFKYCGKELDKMQARLCPSLIPLFPRDIKDEKRNEGKKGRTC